MDSDALFSHQDTMENYRKRRDEQRLGKLPSLLNLASMAIGKKASEIRAGKKTI
jgi:hypothetical protein